MRKNFNYFYFLIVLLIYAVINVVLFIFINKAKLENPEFWLAWSFSTCGNIAFDLVYFIYIKVKGINIASKPSLLLTISGINFVLLIVNLVFALSGVNALTILITDSVLGFIAIAITVYLFHTNKEIEELPE